MQPSRLLQLEQHLAMAGQRFEIVLVPGLYDSDVDHWQSHWQRRFPFWRRVTLRNWSEPDILRWTDAIRRCLADCRRPAVLVGHSMGALASARFAAEQPEQVAGLMLVAPAEPARFELEEMVPAAALPAPSVLAASHDDPLLRFSSARDWAARWGSRLEDLGDAGHVNSEAGFGPWPHGLDILARLIDSLP